MKSLSLNEDSNIKTNLRALWYLGFAVFVIASFVTLYGYRVNQLEARADVTEKTIIDIDKDRTERREAVMSALTDIKIEQAATRTEIRLLRDELHRR